jgi:hypothetical protein
MAKNSQHILAFIFHPRALLSNCKMDPIHEAGIKSASNDALSTSGLDAARTYIRVSSSSSESFELIPVLKKSSVPELAKLDQS